MPEFSHDPSRRIAPDAVPIDARIDALCDRFEAAWKAGATPDIKALLQEVEAAARPLAFQELLRVELEMRRKRGESPALDDYLNSFGEYVDLVRDLFRSADRRQAETIVAPSSAAGYGLHARCPHCHNPIELVAETKLNEVRCLSCGDSFSLTSDTASTDASRPTKLGQYELVEKIGMGAFGVVWKARDTRLDRLVAIKVPRKGQLNNEEIEKFLREARAAAQLRHPNIVSVHEVVRETELVYLVNDLIDGTTLDDWVETQQLTSRQAAELCVKVANALQHAHDQGVIHRDLKPQNILMDRLGEPHLSDFGLAKREAGEMTMTMDGQLIGTPAYMSPEQARGESHDADARSDVYSLGVILFLLLTGELPFRGNVRMLLKQIVEDDPPSSRTLNSSIARDLDTICQKCLAKEPAKRYQTAAELANDLQRFLHHEVIRARPVGRLERTWQWCRRRPLAAALSGSVLSLLLLVAIAAPTAAFLQLNLRRQVEASEAAAIQAFNLAEEKKRKAQKTATTEAEARRAAEAFVSRLQRSQFNSRLADAFRASKNDPKGALAIADDSDVCPIQLRDLAWRFLQSPLIHQRSGQAKVEFRHEAPQAAKNISILWDLQISRDGRILASESFRRIRIWDTASHEKIAEFDVPESELGEAGGYYRAPIWLLAPSGDHVLAQTGDRDSGTVVVFSTHDGSILTRTSAFQLKRPRRIPFRRDAFSGEIRDYIPQAIGFRNGRVAIDHEGVLVIWNMAGGEPQTIALPDKMALLAVQFVNDSELIGVIAADAVLTQERPAPAANRTAPAAKLVAINLENGISELADLGPNLSGADIAASAERIVCRRRIPVDSRRLDYDAQSLTCYDLERTNSKTNLRENFIVKDIANWFTFLGNGEHLVISNDDPQHWIRDASTGKLLHFIGTPPFGVGWRGYGAPEDYQVKDIATSAGTKASYYAYGDGAIRKQAWDGPTYPIDLPHAVLAGHVRDLRQLVFLTTAIGRSIVAVGSTLRDSSSQLKSSAISIWDINDGKLLQFLELPTIELTVRSPRAVIPDIRTISISPDDRYLALGLLGQGIYILDRSSGTMLSKSLGGATSNIAFSPDGAAVFGMYSQLNSVDPTTGERQGGSTVKDEIILSVVALAKGTFLAGTDKGNVYEMKFEQDPVLVFRHSAAVVSICRCGTSDRVACLSGGTVKVIDLQSEKVDVPLYELADEAEIRAVTCSPDGSTLVTRGGGLSFWDCETGQLRGTSGYSFSFVSPDGTRLIGESMYGARIYDLTVSPMK